MYRLAIVLVSITSFLSIAHADTNRSGSLILSLAGVANSRVSEIQENQERTRLNFGAGALIEAGVNDHFGIETGALFINRQYDVEAAGLRVVQEVSRLHIPVLARFWATDFFSVAAGPFVAFRTGDTETSLEVGSTEIGSITTSADDDVEFGLDAAMTFNFAVNNKSGIFVEGRYSAPLGNDQDEDANQVSALAGLKIDI